MPAAASLALMPTKASPALADAGPRARRAARMNPVDEQRFEGLLNRGRMPQDPREAPEFLRYLCRQVEAQIAGTVLKTARQAFPAGGYLSGGFAGAMYQGLADEEYARLVAAGGGFGLGDALYTQLFAGRAYAAGAATSLGGQDVGAQLDAAGISSQTPAVIPQGAPEESDNRIGRHP